MRNEIKSFVPVLVLALVFTSFACRKSAAENGGISPSTVVAASPTPTANPIAATKTDSSIRKVDFKNFTYPWTKEMSSDDEKTFTLKNGEREFVMNGQSGVSLMKPVYGDVTGDGAEEAFIDLNVETGGSSVPNMIYVYTLEDKKPKLLWSFDTGDRAIGGFKKIYAENGVLVVENFGDSKFENGKWIFSVVEGKFKGMCCPALFSKNRFKWNGSEFVVEGTPELFDYDWEKRREAKN